MEITLNDNITLKALDRKDAKHIFETIDSQRAYLGKWLPFVAFTMSESDSQAFVDATLSIPSDRQEFTFTINVDGQFAGLIGLKSTDTENLNTEIGYWLAEQYQGKGIISKSVSALCEYAFNNMKMNRIVIKCAVGNTRSSNIPKRLGFKFEGIEREAERTAEGSFFDIEVYSLLQREFK